MTDLLTWAGRDPKRIDPFLARFGALWKAYPDMRFGQLVTGIAASGVDIFNIEEDRWLDLIASTETKWRQGRLKPMTERPIALVERARRGDEPGMVREAPRGRKEASRLFYDLFRRGE